jgi:FkbM family methyltransferase
MKTIHTSRGTFNLFSNDFVNNKLLDYINTSKIKKIQTILHLGANNGILDIELCRTYPGINIYAFEPRNEYFTLMKQNVIDNNIENIHILNNTLAHVTGEIDVTKFRKSCDYDELFDISKNSIVNINNIFYAITMDELFLLNCELLILELEGFHKLALCGGIKTIQKFKPTIIFVKNNFDNIEKQMGIHVSLNGLLNKFKYQVYDLDDTYSMAIWQQEQPLQEQDEDPQEQPQSQQTPVQVELQA